MSDGGTRFPPRDDPWWVWAIALTPLVLFSAVIVVGLILAVVYA